MSEIISTHELQFTYSGESKAALSKVSLQVQSGELLAVLGHNGSGKSTLAKHFNAILLPSGGKCYIDGIDTTIEEKLFQVRQTAGMVFQNPDNQIVATVVEEDVAFGLENLGVPPTEIRARVDDALQRVGMSNFATHAPHQLSGGQKQRVAIAGIVAMRPKVIILDEPTAMLDPRGRKEVMETIQELNRDFGVTVVLITHFMDEATKCNRVVVIDEGRVIMDGTPSKVFASSEQLKSVGLDVPMPTELLLELKKLGYPVDTTVITAEAAIEEIARLLEHYHVEKKGADR